MSDIDNTIVKTYINKISQKYNIKINDLTEKYTENLSLKEKLQKLSVKQLKEICKQKKVKCTGKKSILIDNILENNAVKEVKPKNVILDNISKNIKVIVIKRNQFNNFEHLQTSLVFDNKTKKVIGKQNINGTIDSLTQTDIEICRDNQFSYIIPDNLNNNSTTENLFNDEDILSDEEEEEEEEEEEKEEYEDEDNNLLLDDTLLVENSDIDFSEQEDHDFSD